MPSLFRPLRLLAPMLGLCLLMGCAGQPLGHRQSAQQASSAEALRLARVMRDNGRLMAASEIYARLDRQGGLSPRESLEYASVAGGVLPAQDTLALFVRARQRLGGTDKLTPDEKLVVCLGIGRGRLALGQIEGAGDDFRCVLAVDGDNVQALNGLGVVFDVQGRPVEAEALLQKALDLDPSNPAVRNNLALSRIGRGEVGAAIDLLEIGNGAETPTLTLNLALAHLLQGDAAKARSALETHFPGIQTESLLEGLSQSAARIRDGSSPAVEMLSASRHPLTMASR